jgi:hypothetical protein
MNTLLLIVLASCPPGGDPGWQPAPAPVAAYPDAGPPYSGSSHQARPRFFGRLRGHRPSNSPSISPSNSPNNKCSCAGNGHADGDWRPAAAAPAPAFGTGTVVEAMTPEPAPTVVAPLATAEQAPRLVPPPQAVTTSTEPTVAAPADGAPRRMPRGPSVTSSAEPPGN